MGNAGTHKKITDTASGNKKRKNIRAAIIPWLFLTPGVVFTVWLKYYPIVRSFFISVYNYKVVKPPGTFIGLKNYTDLLKQSAYINSWENTFVFLILGLVLTFWPPLVQALALSEVKKTRKLFSTIYLLASLIPVSISVILWKWIWYPPSGSTTGLMNMLFRSLNLPQQTWLNDPNLVKFCIIFPGIIGGGAGVLIYLAAILGIPEEIYESAQIDGCVGFKKIIYITLPNITFLIKINFIISVIGILQIMDTIFQLTNGGPANHSASVSFFIFNTIYSDLNYGKASAAAVLLFMVIAVLTVIQIKLDRSESAA